MAGPGSVTVKIKKTMKLDMRPLAFHKNNLTFKHSNGEANGQSCRKSSDV